MKEDRIKVFQGAVAKIKADRDWHQFHQPKDLLLGIIEEIGEFRNLIKWEQNPDIIKRILVTDCSLERKNEIINFFGDVLWYLASLADYCNIDLGEAMTEIIKELEQRFPIKKVKGSTANPKTGGFDGKYNR
jgi:NTP pyrophosphatase (non-canonical NTP hydrolase)